MSVQSVTIEGYVDKSEWGSLFDITTNLNNYTQNEIQPDAQKKQSEKKIVKAEEFLAKSKYTKDDDNLSLASFAKTDSDYKEDALRKDVKEDEYESNMVLMEDLAVIGPVPLMFFLPEWKMKQSYCELIERHGGLVVEFIECWVYQIYPEEEKEYIQESKFFKGYVYSSNWINDWIQQRATLSPQNYLKYDITVNGQDINFSRTKFSIREVVKLFKATRKYPSRKNKNPTYWKSMLDKQFFPGRSAHSLNNQWQRFSDLGTLEGAIRHALNLKMHYWINFKAVPNTPEIVMEVRNELKSRAMYLKKLSMELENENWHMGGLSTVASHIISKTSATKLDQEIMKLLNSNVPVQQYNSRVKDEEYSEIGAETSRWISDVDPNESRALGMPHISTKVEEGKLMLPECDMKNEYSVQNQSSFPKKNQHFIKYFDIPLPELPQDDDIISWTSFRSGRKGVQKILNNRKRRRVDAVDYGSYDVREHISQHSNIDDWDRMSYTGPYAKGEPDLLGMAKRIKLEEHFDALTKSSLPDISVVLNKTKNDTIPTKKTKEMPSLSGKFDKIENEQLISPSEVEFQSLLIEIPSLQGGKARKQKQRIIHNMEFEQKAFKSKEDIISSIEYLLKTYTSTTPEDMNQQLNNSKRDLFRLNGDFKRYEKYLKGEKVQLWTPLEDIIILKKDSTWEEYKALSQDKGEEEMETRKQFLVDPQNIFKKLFDEAMI